ncbi:adenosine receptor A2a-like, partial [Octopus bimaculoides]
LSSLITFSLIFVPLIVPLSACVSLSMSIHTYSYVSCIWHLCQWHVRLFFSFLFQLQSAKQQQSTMGVQTKQNAKRDAQTAKSVLIIVFLFLVSWFPLYTINAIMLFCEDCVIPPILMNFAVILSHANSVWNPGLYAWGLSDFRDALHKVMCPCRSSSTLPLAATTSIRRQSHSVHAQS